MARTRLYPTQSRGRLFPRQNLRRDALGGGQIGGTPLLPDELANAYVSVQAAFGAPPKADPATWEAYYVDITRDVLQDNGRTVSIKVGRTDWSNFAYPATLTLALKNLSGDYSAWNGYARWWPHLVAGTPIRVRVILDGVPYDRFVGEATGWQPSFDATGNYAIVILTASGVLQRVAGGTGQDQPLHTPFTRSILAAGPKHYWPLEDGSNATSGAALTNNSPLMTMVGTVRFGALDLYTAGQSEGITLLPGTTFGTNNLPQHKDGGALVAVFPETATPWSVQFLTFVAIDSSDVDQIYSPIDWFTADGSLWRISHDPYGTDTTVLDVNGVTVCTVPGLWVFEDMRVDAVQSGPDIAVTFRRQAFGSPFATGTIAGTTLRGVTRVATNPKRMITHGDWMTSHVRVWETTSEPNFQTSITDVSAIWAYKNETPTTRLSRLCGEEAIPYATTGRASPNITMGPQAADTLANLLREAESTDGGLLYDGLGPGLQYQPLYARYNATPVLALDASTGDLQPAYQPVDDQMGRINRGVVTSRDGSTAAYTDVTGNLGTDRTGDRTGGPPTSVNYVDATKLPARAAWEVRKGTVEGFRYPNLYLNLRTIPGKVAGWLTVTPGALVSVTPPYPTQLTTDTLLEVVEGWQEDIAKKQWMVTAYCSRGDVYQVGALNTMRLSSPGSTLAADAPAGSTSLSVASSGDVWSTNAAYLPNDFWIDGIRVTVTAISGSSSPQTFTVTPTSRQLYAGNTVRLWARAYPALG